MNSIDTCAPTPLWPAESEDDAILINLAGEPDAEALGALRALMGGLPLPGASAGVSTLSAADDKAVPLGGGTLRLLGRLLSKSEELPPELVSLLRQFAASSHGTAGGGSAAQFAGNAAAGAEPALVSQLKSLLKPLAEEQEHVVSVDAPWVPGMPQFFSPGAGLASEFAAVANSGTEVAALAQALLKALQDPAAPALGSSLLEEDGSDAPGIDFAQPPQPDTSNLGSAILQSLGQQSAPVATAAPSGTTAAGAPAAERLQEVGNLITQLADRVLVSDPLHGQTQEVRIKLADSIMEGTEVRVWREDAGGPLRIEFETSSAYWARVLNEASPLLSQRLSERLAGTAEVLVGVQQHAGQPEDGRSRNRQNPWELAREQSEES